MRTYMQTYEQSSKPTPPKIANHIRKFLHGPPSMQCSKIQYVINPYICWHTLSKNQPYFATAEADLRLKRLIYGTKEFFRLSIMSVPTLVEIIRHIHEIEVVEICEANNFVEKKVSICREGWTVTFRDGQSAWYLTVCIVWQATVFCRRNY